MSFDDLSRYLNDTDERTPNGRPAGGAADLDADIELLRSLTAESGQISSDSELSELLERLDSAGAMAGEVEAKLDGILGTLDDLLGNLEPKTTDNSREGDPPGPPSESQSESPPSKKPES